MATRKTPTKTTAEDREALRPGKCKRCRRPHGEVHVSFRGLCTDCAIAAVTDANRSMAERKGPAYDKWVESMSRVVEEARSA